MYSAARQCSDQRNYEWARQLADEGFQKTAKDDLVVNYKFRILKAELAAYATPMVALQLLEVDPPRQLPPEFAARRELTQGESYTYLSNFSRAQTSLAKTSRYAELNAPEILPKVLVAQAYLARRQGDKEAEEKYYRDAAGLANKYRQPWVQADALINIATIQMDREQYDLAIDTLESAPKGLPQFQEEMISGKLGWSFYNIGELSQAISFLANAESVSAMIGLSEDQQLWSLDLGDAYLSQGDYGNAEKSYLNAYALGRVLGPTRNGVMAFHNLAQLELERGNVQKADDYNQQALTADARLDDEYVRTLCTLSTAEIAIKQHEFSKAEPLLFAITAKSHDSSLLWSAQSDLANLYVAEKKPVQADREFQAALRTIENAREKVQKEERRMSILDAWPFYDDYIRFLIDQHHDQKAAQVAEFSRSRTLAEGLGIVGQKESGQAPIQRVYDVLRAQDKVILAYWLADKESYLWVITPEGIKTCRLRPHQEIEKEIQSYNEKLQARDLDDAASGEKLYDLLVRPAEKLIGSAKQIIIIPHRSLYKLNFETLVVPQPKPHYWIEDVTLEVAGSVSLLARSNRAISEARKKLLLIGAPIKASDDFGVLIHAGEEIQKVKAHFPPPEETVVEDRRATPSAYASAQPVEFRYIHFVTHGTASDTSPLDSAIILSPQAQGAFKLYARDILKIPVKAEVVTISACYGAGTKWYSGEGLVGLAWAFMRAGAHQVVAGLWEVDDRATPDLMDNFYTGLKRKSAAAALRDAKLKLVHSPGVYRLPYFWGSLQLYSGS